ncbi:MAG TPA: HypC/HybG/HupF family hydrogenase formation chaperone [Terriglobales bacterium]|nr:HypC/HybG/HupF family hydrogenase formation chaperone [Terriglobales bacterium]
MCLAVPGKILDIKVSDGMRVGRVEFGGIARQVSLDFVPQAAVGDYVMVHVGFAISQVDRQEAERTRQVMANMQLLEGEADPGD